MTDPILLWNDVALEANRVSHTNGLGEQAGPPLSARALALAHLAMYDAYAGCINDPTNLPLYYAAELKSKLPPAKTPPDEAVAVAASLTLSWLFPSQSLTFRRLREAVTTDETSAAYAFGKAVYEAVRVDREDDPGVGSAGYTPPVGRGKHRPDPDNPDDGGFHAPDYGRLSRGFATQTRFELGAPPFDDDEYLAALRQVRGKGIKPELAGTLPDDMPYRTPDETITGIFWAYDGAAQLGTPPRLYNQIVRTVAAKQGNTPDQNARLFAFVNVAMADAGILAWDQKYIYEFWRPVLGIREHDPSLGPVPQSASTDPARAEISPDGDPYWLPLGAPRSYVIGKNFTPPFPAYPSGHATFGAAALHITRLFYGKGGTYQGKDLSADELFDDLHFVSEELNNITRDNTGTVRPLHRRQFPEGLWDMILENGFSRVALGVHWIFDAFVVKKNGQPDLYRKVDGKPFGGLPLGFLIAEEIFNATSGKAPSKDPKKPFGPRPVPTGPPTARTQTHRSNYIR